MKGCHINKVASFYPTNKALSLVSILLGNLYLNVSINSTLVINILSRVMCVLYVTAPQN